MAVTPFRSPVRRKVRQRSGFEVTTETTGGEAKLKFAKTIIFKKQVLISVTKSIVRIIKLFKQDLAIIAFGGFVRSDENITIETKFLVKMSEGQKFENVKKFIPKPGVWFALGDHIEISDCKDKHVTVSLNVSIESTTSTENVEADIFGFSLGAVDKKEFIENLEYGDGEDIRTMFNQKTSICIPYLYYLTHDAPLCNGGFSVSVKGMKNCKPVMLKSCNRCGRYLLVEYGGEKQKNILSFGNHCVKNAPCTHGAFGTQRVTENEIGDYSKFEKLNSIIRTANSGLVIHINYGYQLECRACKKFFVNAPLNPMRNSTQHREDSLRRRAIEVLVDTLLKNEWIYHKFRQKEKTEFDKHIWEKFGKKCFKCKKIIPTVNDMDLDHTMPLSALWPLDETATCLCSSCNANKSDKFPVEYYTEDELVELAKITGVELSFLESKSINKKVLNKLVEKVDWFFDEFLSDKNYQKIRGEKRSADLILKAIIKQIRKAKADVDLIEQYKAKTGRYPTSVTLKKN